MNDLQRVGTDHWYALRAAAIARAGGACERCGRRPSADASLCLTLLRRPPIGEETLDEVQAVCVICLHQPKPARPLAFRRPR